MRPIRVRKVVPVLFALGLVAVGACDDNPLEFDVENTTSLRVNPTTMTVPAGAAVELNVTALNEGQEPTFEDVNATVAACGTGGTVTVAPNPARVASEPPGRFLVTGGSTLGTVCVAVSAGGVTDTSFVTVVAAAIDVVSAPDTLRSGESGTVVAQLVDAAGSPVTPYAAADAVWASDDTDVIVVDATGGVTAGSSGSATVSVTWNGQAANETVVAGYTLSDDATITVVANVPASAAFDVGTNLGAFPVGEESTYEVVVSDANGNQNTNEAEILGVTVASSDDLVATATGELVPGASVQVFVTVTAVGGGQADISGTVQTTAGDLPFTGTYSVVAPAVTAVNPDPAQAGQPITLTGSGWFPGLETTVTFNGYPDNGVTVTSPTEMTVTPALMGNAGLVTIVVNVQGVDSPPFTYTEVGTWDAEDWEPDNETFGSEPNIGFPLNFTGDVEGATDFDDWFRVLIPAGGGTIDIVLDWDDAGNDVDVYINDVSGAPALTIPPIVCFDGGTLGKPEVTSCTVPAGEHIVWIADFGPGVSNYTVTGTFTP